MKKSFPNPKGKKKQFEKEHENHALLKLPADLKKKTACIIHQIKVKAFYDFLF